MATPQTDVEFLATQEYKYGFVTDIEQETVPPGLNEDVVRLISAKKGEPEWLLDWRLKAYRALAEDAGADVGEREVPPHRLPGHPLLLRPQEGGLEVRRALTISIPSC